MTEMSGANTPPRFRTNVRVLVTMTMALSLGVLTSTMLQPDQASAHCVTGDKLKTLQRDADRFVNFDFTSKDVAPCKVDWPVNFLFDNNASVPRVKNAMAFAGYGDSGINTADEMWGRVDNGAGWQWDRDKGGKNGSPTDCAVGDVEHFRLYGNVGANNAMYNMSWGYYVLGTSHIDEHECTGGPSGRSEEAENRIADDARGISLFGTVESDQVNFQNHLDFEVASDGHKKMNSGDGTRVRVR